MANNFFKNRNGISLGSLSAAPSNPVNGDFYYDTTLKKFQKYENGVWGSFGSGGSGSSKNYLTAYTASTASGTPNTGNGDLEAGSTSGFSLGHAALTSNFPSGAPTFGSGASGNLSLSAISSSQIAGLYSLGYVSSAATTAGDFVATDAFFIDKEDQAHILAFKFSYNAFTNPTNGNFSGTSSNSFGVAIWDVTNSAWIQPAGVYNIIQNSGVGFCTGTFQTTSNSTQYRLVVFNANASSGAITMYFDDFFVGPQVSVNAPAMTDWQTYTPTVTGLGSGGSATNSGLWRRVGDSMEIQITWTKDGTGGTGSSAVTWSLPAGYTMDTTRMSGTTTQSTLGQAQYQAPTNYSSLAEVQASSTSAVTVTRVGTAIDLAGSDYPANSQVRILAKFPISGWSSNSSMSSDTDTRVVAAAVNNSTNTSLTASDAAIPFANVDFDTHGAFSGSTYTVPVSGKYRVTARIRISANALTTSQAIQTSLYKNGSKYKTISTRFGNGAGVDTSTEGSITVDCKAGDTLVIQAQSGANANLDSNGSENYAIFERLSGPAVVAASEAVAARYHSVSAQVVTPSTQTFDFEVKDFDTHNAVSGTGSGIGGTWKFTAPVSGLYKITASVGFQNTAPTDTVSRLWRLHLRKNGSDVSYIGVRETFGTTTQSGNVFAQGSDLIKLVAGDTISVGAEENVNSTSSTSTTNATDNYVSIVKVG